MSLYDSATNVMIPSGYKAGTLYSVVPNTAAGDFDVARNSVANRVDSNSVLEEMAVDVPRIQYDSGVTCPYLLAEQQSTNLFLNSAVGVTQDITVTSGVSYTMYFLSGEGTITLSDAATEVITVSDNEYDNAVTFTTSSTTLTCTVTDTANLVQCELGANPTSYIVTEGTTVIRLKDEINLPSLTTILTDNNSIIDHYFTDERLTKKWNGESYDLYKDGLYYANIGEPIPSQYDINVPSKTSKIIMYNEDISNTLLELTDKPTPDVSTSQGLSWDSSSDTYARLGDISAIATSQSAGDGNLPIQSEMKRCLLNDDGTVNYYIDTTDPTLKSGGSATSTGTTDGTTADKLVDSGADFVTDGVAAGMFVHNTTDDTYSIITAVDDLNTLSLERDVMVSGENYSIGDANYGGADGQVMVEVPKFYYYETLVGTVKSWYVSLTYIEGFSLHPAFWKDGQEVDYRYMSAFEGGMYDASTGLMCAKGSIPSNIYASGDKMTSVAGTWAKTNEQRSEYRTMAAERGTGWRQLDYYLHSAIQLLYLVEYADFNSQSMIGDGRTNLSGGGWTADSYIGLTGLSVDDGNGTNAVQIGTTNGYLTDYMTYRGIENWHGNVWKMIDGITWDGRWTGSAAAQPVYVTNNSTYFADQTSDNMLHLCNASYIGTNAGYIGNIEEATGFIPSDDGGSSSTDLCDYYYQYSESGRDYWRVVLVGGTATSGGLAGAFFVSAHSTWSTAYTYIGGRLCF